MDSGRLIRIDLDRGRGVLMDEAEARRQGLLPPEPAAEAMMQQQEDMPSQKARRGARDKMRRLPEAADKGAESG